MGYSRIRPISTDTAANYGGEADALRMILPLNVIVQLIG
jgi:hypothetical protein